MVEKRGNNLGPTATPRLRRGIYLLVVVLASNEQRGERPVVLCLDGRPRCPQLSHRIQVAPFRREQQRREPSVAPSLDVDAPFYELASGSGIKLEM